MTAVSSSQMNGNVNHPYPMNFKQSSGVVDGIQTDVAVYNFADKIFITMSQEGRLAQWMQVPMDPSNPTRVENFLPSDPDDMLPSTSLNARTLLGGGSPDREMTGKLYASQLATMITSRNPDESRSLLVGLGLTKAEASQEQFLDLMELVVKCL